MIFRKDKEIKYIDDIFCQFFYRPLRGYTSRGSDRRIGEIQSEARDASYAWRDKIWYYIESWVFRFGFHLCTSVVF